MVSRDIRRILTQRARYFNIVLDDVSITQVGAPFRLSFPAPQARVILVSVLLRIILPFKR